MKENNVCSKQPNFLSISRTSSQNLSNNYIFHSAVRKKGVCREKLIKPSKNEDMQGYETIWKEKLKFLWYATAGFVNSAKNGLNTRFPVYGRFVLHLAYTFCRA